MAKPRKAKTLRKRGSAKLIKELEKLAEALERNAAHKRGHYFGTLDSGENETTPQLEKAS